MSIGDALILALTELKMQLLQNRYHWFQSTFLLLIKAQIRLYLLGVQLRNCVIIIYTFVLDIPWNSFTHNPIRKL